MNDTCYFTQVPSCYFSRDGKDAMTSLHFRIPIGLDSSFRLPMPASLVLEAQLGNLRVSTKHKAIQGRVIRRERNLISFFFRAIKGLILRHDLRMYLRRHVQVRGKAISQS